ncbi:uncharacterized protein B0H18DRAFT_1130078 [Fomitopsis serialis]|uniref:uncharacterized protein n=1 Tax=Fomitopsis serialis TaxID=139415 RepID=UPI00200862EC|nr:uncharacterized protein B0H18DRAFT_1130078 [Neoantrodia serialis]KAH9910474.1 hypothetical protein B0H18DRAFT_1130078 [Neoantrodia serialis]
MVGVISGYILPVESLHWFCRCWVGPFVPEEIPEVEGPREFNAFVNDILCMIDWIRGLERSKLVPPVSWLLPDRGETAVIVTGYEDQKKGVSRIPEDDRQVRARDWFVKHANLVAGENIFVSDNLQYFCTAEENLELPLALCFDPPPQTGKEKAAEPKSGKPLLCTTPEPQSSSKTPAATTPGKATTSATSGATSGKAKPTGRPTSGKPQSPGKPTSAAKPGSAKPTSSGKPASTRATSSGKPANAGGKPAGVRKVPAAVIAETSDVEGGDGNGSEGANLGDGEGAGTGAGGDTGSESGVDPDAERRGEDEDIENHVEPHTGQSMDNRRYACWRRHWERKRRCEYSRTWDS